MKYLFCSLLFLCTMLSAQSQSAVNEKVSEAFSAEEMAKMTPENVDYYTFFLDNAYRVLDSEKENSSLNDLSLILNKKTGESLQSSDLSNSDFNALLFDLKQDKVSPTFYKMGDTGKVLMVQSSDRLALLYSRHKANKR